MAEIKSKDKTSMLYWWPKIRGLSVPTPKTELIPVAWGPDDLEDLVEGKPPEFMARDIQRIQKSAEDHFSFPLFLRSDQTSAKHSWKRTCFVNNAKDIPQHIYDIVEFSLIADILGLPVGAFALREYIEMASAYTAFWGEMPVCPERRYFINKKQVVCHHPYWIKEAIETPSVNNWRQLSDKINQEGALEVSLLTNYAEQVAAILPEYWSVDFCRAKDGRWLLIDLAEGHKSWHPEDCDAKLGAEGQLRKKGC